MLQVHHHYKSLHLRGIKLSGGGKRGVTIVSLTIFIGDEEDGNFSLVISWREFIVFVLKPGEGTTGNDG